MPVLKPLDLEPYKGKVDLPMFHCFIRQMSDYLGGYCVRSHNHPSMLACFLQGHVHEFYVNTILCNPCTYQFKDIFIRLFNYCFPINFHQKMHEKLKNTHQHGPSIQSYSYEMENLFLILGMDWNEERVDMFWFGLDKYIQSKLWKQMMALKSLYEDVKAKAQVIKLAHEAAGGGHTKHTGLQWNGGFHCCYNHPSALAAAIAVPQQNNDHQHGHGRGNCGECYDHHNCAELGIYVGNVNHAPAKQQNCQHNHQNGGQGHNHQVQWGNCLQNPNPGPPRQCKAAAAAAGDGRCFQCGEPGHMACNCPWNNHIWSDHWNEAPGLATYNVEVAPDNAEVLQNLAESTSVTTELHLNSVEFDYQTIPCLQLAWDLVEPHFQFDHLTGLVSTGDTSEHDFKNMFDDLPSLQSVSNSSSEPEEPGNVSDNI